MFLETFPTTHGPTFAVRACPPMFVGDLVECIYILQSSETYKGGFTLENVFYKLIWQAHELIMLESFCWLLFSLYLYT